MENSQTGEQEYEFPDYAEKEVCNGGRITNTLEDQSVVGKFNLAVSNSPLNQKEAIEEALKEVTTEDDAGLPTLKEDVKEDYQK